MSKFMIHFCAAITVALCASQPVIAQKMLTKKEDAALAGYLKILRAGFMPDGAINMTQVGKEPTSPVWIAPYFGDHVAISLLVANNHKAKASDVTLIGKWIEWRVNHQEKGGF